MQARLAFVLVQGEIPRRLYACRESRCKQCRRRRGGRGQTLFLYCRQRLAEAGLDDHAVQVGDRPPRGGILQDSGYNEVWDEARREALTPAQYRSPLGRRPYDLRHAAVSLWLNSGVPATEVARRAGHGVAVLLKIYAHCIDGQAAANQRITDALDIRDAEPDQGDEDDDDTEQAP
jgi:hypothetical protein